MVCKLVSRSALALSLFSLAFLTVLAWEFEYFWWDVEICHLAQQLDSPLLIQFLLGLSWLGAGWTPWILGSLTGLLTFWANPTLKKWAVVLWVGLASGAALMYLLKFLIQRPRPDATLASVLADYPGFSYPSGHVIFFVQYFGFLVVLLWCVTDRIFWRVLLTGVLILPVLFVGLSRVFVGAHWASDVLGGYLAGGILLAAMVAFFKSVRNLS